jgi:hypothetical protein
MSTVALTFTPATAARLEQDDEARRRLEAMAEALFGEPAPYRMTPEEEAMIDEALEEAETAVKEGRARRFDPEASKERMRRLLAERAEARKEAA